MSCFGKLCPLLHICPATQAMVPGLLFFRGNRESVRQAGWQDGETLLVLSSLSISDTPQVSTCPSSPSPALCTRAAPPADCWRSAEGTQPSTPNCGSSRGTNSRDGNQTCCYGNLASSTGEGTTPPLCSSCEALIRNSMENFHAAQEQERRRLTGDTSRAKDLTAWSPLGTCSANPLLFQSPTNATAFFIKEDTAARRIPSLPTTLDDLF